ncbi:MAG: VanW family protein, partial [Oscillospiraceae bacterium]|nr:VanW family protein [Oscillospiraceae bacterium]
MAENDRKKNAAGAEAGQGRGAAPGSRAEARARAEAEEREKREWIARRMREDEEKEAERKRQARAAAAERKRAEREEDEKLRRKEQEQKEAARQERAKAAAAGWAKVVKGLKIALLAILALVVLLGVAGAYIGFKVSNSTTNFPNVTVNGIKVGGLTREETAKKLAAEGWDEASGKKLTVTLPMGLSVELDRQEAGMGLAMNEEEAAELAYSYGHGNNVVDNVLKYADARIKTTALTVEAGELDLDYVKAKADEAVAAFRKKTAGDSYTIDEENKVLHFIKGAGQMDLDRDKLYEAMLKALQDGSEALTFDEIVSNVAMPDFQALYDQLNVEPQNAYFLNKDFEIEPEVIGCTFDPAEAQKLWEKAEVMEELLIPLEILEPEVKAEDLEGMLFRDLLGSQTSSYSGSSRSRINNINLAVSKINGIILMPGETFSYNATVGQRTLAAGFEEAAAYSNGEVVQEVGGGICQVSSTLYCATLYARMTTVSRTNHYFRVTYLPLGQDATVSWPEPDFQFRNDREYPVKIIAYCNNNSL